MHRIRSGRRFYYNVFSHFYDAFIRLHSRHHENGTRSFIADAAESDGKNACRILDVCCGTGAVASAFREKYSNSLIVGCDFSRGMLRKAQKKNAGGKTIYVEGDASRLPFFDNSFDIITCSHALYELKGESRKKALAEMNRVMRASGQVLIMEHAVPKSWFVKFLFYMRMFTMGSSDAGEFVREGSRPYECVFTNVSLSMSPSGKSRLFTCRKRHG